MRIGGAEIVVLPDDAAAAREAASRTVEALRAALAARGEAHLALTGGSSGVALYRELAIAPWRDAIAWDHVHFWWGDERFVPRDHPESNAGLADRTLFDIGAFSGESGTGAFGADVEDEDQPGLLIDADKVHPIETEEAIAHATGPAWAAQAYAGEIERFIPSDLNGVPVFDVMHLGVGPDGHTLSVFPGSAALAPDAPLVMAIDAPTHVPPPLPRVTLAARVLPAARSVIVLVMGSTKPEIIATVLGPEHDPSHWPAQAAVLPNATWILDQPAAALLPRS